MRIFVLGSVDVAGDEPSGSDHPDPVPGLRKLGALLAGAGHELLLCSPHRGSLDREILEGAAGAGVQVKVEMHYPRSSPNEQAVQALADDLGIAVERRSHPSGPDNAGTARSYAWLLCQLSALDRAEIVIAAGGALDGSASMLLRLAEGRGVPILPFAHAGGAAALSLARQRYALCDRLGGDLLEWLSRPEPMDRVAEAIPLLLDGGPGRDSGYRRFFLSYSREQAAEADFVESTLRRRALEVFRDDQDIGADEELNVAIREAICRSDVFVALWSREYACSPWCFDEIELAIRRRGEGRMAIWVLDLDGTRLVYPGIRGLPAQPAAGREQMQATLLRLLGGGQASSA